MQRAAPKLELLEFKCVDEDIPRGILISGAVKNVSDKPLPLSANVLLTGNPNRPLDLRSDIITGPVTPTPLPPGESGRFEIRAPRPAGFPRPRSFDQPMAIGYCKLRAFTDDSTGEGVNYRERER